MANPNPKTDHLKPFKKGVSGNPGGRRKLAPEDKDAIEMLREGAPACARLMLDAAAGKRATMAQITAAKDILDRVYGKPHQSSDVTLRPAGPQLPPNAHQLTRDQLREHLLGQNWRDHYQEPKQIEYVSPPDKAKDKQDQ
jgi:hypothetical protein